VGKPKVPNAAGKGLQEWLTGHGGDCRSANHHRKPRPGLRTLSISPQVLVDGEGKEAWETGIAMW
jgi:hypothetical protein